MMNFIRNPKVGKSLSWTFKWAVLGALFGPAALAVPQGAYQSHTQDGHYGNFPVRAVDNLVWNYSAEFKLAMNTLAAVGAITPSARPQDKHCP